jgi:hypothetical protein
MTQPVRMIIHYRESADGHGEDSRVKLAATLFPS